MRVKEKENLYLLDKDYEVWGLEEEELLITVVVGLLPPFLFSFLVSPFVSLISPFTWTAMLFLLKNRKSKEGNLRGGWKRKIVVGVEKLLKRNVYYA